MWPVIRRTSVPPTEMSKDHRPPSSPTGGAARPACRRWERQNLGGPPRRAQPHSLDPRRFSPSGVPRRWHRRCLTDRHRQRCSDERRIPPPSARHVAHCTPGRSPVRRRTRAAQAPANGAGSFERNGPAPHISVALFPLDPPAAGYALSIPSAMIQMRYRSSRPCKSARRPQQIPPQSIVHFDERPHDCVEWAPNRVARCCPSVPAWALVLQHETPSRLATAHFWRGRTLSYLLRIVRRREARPSSRSHPTR